jgi:hypothetical protein
VCEYNIGKSARKECLIYLIIFNSFELKTIDVSILVTLGRSQAGAGKYLAYLHIVYEKLDSIWSACFYFMEEMEVQFINCIRKNCIHLNHNRQSCIIYLLLSGWIPSVSEPIKLLPFIPFRIYKPSRIQAQVQYR